MSGAFVHATCSSPSLTVIQTSWRLCPGDACPPFGQSMSVAPAPSVLALMHTLATCPQPSHHSSLPMRHPSMALTSPTFTLTLHVHGPVTSMGAVISLGHHRKPDVAFTVVHSSTAARRPLSPLATSSLSTSSPRVLLSATSRSLRPPRAHRASCRR